MSLDYDEKHCNTAGDCYPTPRSEIISDILWKSGDALLLALIAGALLLCINYEVGRELKIRKHWYLTGLHFSLLALPSFITAVEYYRKWMILWLP